MPAGRTLADVPTSRASTRSVATRAHSGSTDYSITTSGSKVYVDWSKAAAEPTAGTGHLLLLTSYYCGDPNIGGVEKHEAPTGGSVVTNANQTTVDGSSSVPFCDLAVASDQAVTGCYFGQGDSTPELDMNNQFRWILPIVQTNTGWDSVIHVTNVSGSSNVGVNVYWYAANGQGVSGPSAQLFSVNLGSGKTKSFDLMADGGIPAGTVGSVWIDADAAVVASVDRVKPATEHGVDERGAAADGQHLQLLQDLRDQPDDEVRAAGVPGLQQLEHGHQHREPVEQHEPGDD